MQQPEPPQASVVTVPVDIFLSYCHNFARDWRLNDSILQALLQPGLWQLEPPVRESLNSLFRRFAETWRVCERAGRAQDGCG
jgi:hypothetical protein